MRAYRRISIFLPLLLMVSAAFAVDVRWDVSAGKAKAVGDKTYQSVIVRWNNPTAASVQMAGTVKVVDYFMRTIGQAEFPANIEAGKSVQTIIDIPTDQAGPYVKVRLEGTQANASIFDEQIVFTEVLTGPRLRMSLNGAWQMNKGYGKWEPCELPYRWDSWQGWHKRMFRKRFSLPVQMKGRRIELQLSGVRFHVKVHLNGKVLADEHTDQMPLTVDLTPAAKPGAANEIVLEIIDWLSCASPEEQPGLVMVWSSAWFQGREIPGMPFIRPATCGLGGAGVSDPIYIIATESEFIDETFVTPSVRKSQLAVCAELKNDTKIKRDMTVRMSVLDGDKVVLEAPAKPVTLEPGMVKIQEEIPFDPAKVQLWWPWKPKLYRLCVELMDGDKLIDRSNVRFGIREFWCDGPVFRINNIPIRPGAFAAIPNDYPAIACYDAKSSLKTWNICKEFLRSFQNINVNLLRFHTEPFPILMFDQADEVGLMVVSEAWMATLPGKMKLSDPRTWEAMREFYPKWVRREFNHPSLVIRSMENELGYHLPGKDEPRTQWGYSNAIIENIVWQMKLLGKRVQTLDPSRPIMYEGSGPVFYDVADIYNLHYPSTCDGGADIAPLDARRFSIPIRSYREKAWVWDRKKPLYVGEYECCYGMPEHFTSSLGDDAYVSGYLISAEAAKFSLAVPAHRIDGVTAGFPHSPLTFNGNPTVLDPKTNYLLGIFTELYAPLATFIHQYRICYYGGVNVTRTVTTLNDTLEPQNITLRWSLTGPDKKVYLHGSKTMTLSPAQSVRTQIPLEFPKVDEITNCEFAVETLTADIVRHKDTRRFILYPEIKPGKVLHARYGVVGDIAEQLKVRGANAKTLNPASLDLNDIDVLVIAGGGKELQPQAGKIESFLRNGGRVIVFADKDIPAFLPVTLEFPSIEPPLTFADDANPGKTFTVPAPGASTAICYPRVPSHPLLTGLQQDQLRYWREGLITAGYTWNKPKDFSALSLIESGIGFSHSALLAIPEGRGVILATTLPVIELADDQPAAAILLDNILSYADSYSSPDRPQAVGLLENDKKQMEPMLQELGVKFYPVAGKLNKLNDLSDYAVFVVAVDETSLDELEKNIEKIRQYVRNGGTVWIQGANPKNAVQISKLIGRSININSLNLTDPIHAQNRGLLSGVTNDELFWPDGAFLPTPSKLVAKNTVNVEGEGVDILAIPQVAISIKDGKGYWLLDEVNWPGEVAHRMRALQYVRAILPNLGLQVRRTNQTVERVFDESLGYEPIDISKFCNEGFKGGVWNGADRGLAGLPVGKAVLNANLYQIVDPKDNGGKACISFYAENQNKNGVKNVTIPVDKKAACIRLLLTSVWTGGLSAGTKILDVEIEYTDGSIKATEVCYGRDVLDWCTTPLGMAKTHPCVAWMGKEWPLPGLFDFVWVNPEPDKVIKSITLKAANDTGFAVVVGITTQQKPSPAETKTANWIPGLEK